MPREKWTDDRLDDLNERVDDGFASVDTDIRELRGEMNARFDKFDATLSRLDAKFDRKFDRLTWGLVGIIAAIIGGNAL